jgi:parallel beta-helix repeat protein
MKRITRIGLSAAVALGMLSLVPGAAFAAAPSCGDTLMVSTTLHADLDCSAYNSTDVLTLGKAGITLNLNGFTIKGYNGSDSYSAVYSSKNNVTVKNGTITGSFYGVYTVGGNGITVKKLTVTGDPADSTSEGIYLYAGIGHTVANNTADGYYYGIDVEYSANDWITGNTVTNSTYGVYIYEDSFDHVSGNKSTADYAGFYDDYSGGQTYSNNIADGDSNAALYGFYLDCNSSGWLTATGNTAKYNNDYGFYIYECYDESNMNSGQTTLISGNKALDNGDDAYGFYDYYSIYATWSGNVAKRNASVGFYLDYPGHDVFKVNTANNNGDDGIYATDNYGPAFAFKTFANNTANNNSDYGLDAESAIPNGTGNVAHNNGYSPDECYNVFCN